MSATPLIIRKLKIAFAVELQGEIFISMPTFKDKWFCSQLTEIEKNNISIILIEYQNHRVKLAGEWISCLRTLKATFTEN